MSPMTPEPSDAPVHGLVVPADVNEPVRVVDLRDGGRPVYRALQEHVGGTIEVVAVKEGDVWCNDEGRILDQPLNVRAAHWMLHDSTDGREGRIGEGQLVYGDVVITGGPDLVGDTTSVSPELVTTFEAMDVNQGAMKDWDVRSTDVTITVWSYGDGAGPDFGL